MEINKLLADEAILAEIGARMVSKRTLERIESGASAQMSSFIRVLRVLDLLPGLEQMISPVGPSPMDLLRRKGKVRQRGPMDLLRRKGKVRQRASSRKHSDQSDKPWTWDDDS
jgi:hypothetical protein